MHGFPNCIHYLRRVAIITLLWPHRTRSAGYFEHETLGEGNKKQPLRPNGTTEAERLQALRPLALCAPALRLLALCSSRSQTSRSLPPYHRLAPQLLRFSIRCSNTPSPHLSLHTAPYLLSPRRITPHLCSHHAYHSVPGDSRLVRKPRSGRASQSSRCASAPRRTKRGQADTPGHHDKQHGAGCLGLEARRRP